MEEMNLAEVQDVITRGAPGVVEDVEFKTVSSKGRYVFDVSPDPDPYSISITFGDGGYWELKFVHGRVYIDMENGPDISRPSDQIMA